MKHVAVAGFLLVAFASAPAVAQTGCASFRIVGAQNQIRYNPYSAAALTSFAVQVSSRSAGATQVRFLLVDRDGAAAGGAGLGLRGPREYRLGVSGNPDRGFGTAADQPTTFNSAVAVLPAEGSDNVMFQLTIAAGQQTRAGSHSQDLVVRFQCLAADGTPVGLPGEQALAVAIEAVVPSFVSANVAGSDRGEIDFGTIGSHSATLTRSLEISAVATLPYEVAVATANAARLLRDPLDTRGIGYAMAYGGVAVLPGGRVLCAQPPLPGARPDTLAVTLAASDIDAVPAGAYSDTITLTFMPRDIVDPGEHCTLQP